METTINIKGMHCKGCERTISNALLGIKGVHQVKVDYTTEKAMVTFDENSTNIKSILAKIEDAGYEPNIDENKGNGKKKKFLGLF